MYQMYTTIQKETGIKIRRMIGSGNGLRKNPVLCEIIEDMFKAELVLAECEEEAATGAAMSSSMYNSSNSPQIIKYLLGILSLDFSRLFLCS